MPAPAPATMQDPMIAAHEQRIQRLEVGFAEVQSTVEGLGVTMEHTQKTIERVESTVNGLDGKLDGVAASLQKTAEEAKQGLEKIHQDDQIEEAEKKATWGVALAVLKKAAIPLTVAATAAITKLGEAGWEWLTHLH